MVEQNCRRRTSGKLLLRGSHLRRWGSPHPYFKEVEIVKTWTSPGAKLLHDNVIVIVHLHPASVAFICRARTGNIAQQSALGTTLALMCT
jgi:hypothetical protein